MEKMKSVFANRKKLTVISACAAIALCIGIGGSVFAAKVSVTQSEAEQAAFADAKIAPSQAMSVKTELDFKRGILGYEVEFTADGTEYEYFIKADDSTVISKETELRKAKSAKIHYDKKDAKHHESEVGTHHKNETAVNDTSEYIGIEKAKQIALQHSNAASSDVTFTKSKTDYDDGRVKYEIEFFLSGVEYEYEIDALSGAILEYDFDYDD